MLGLRVAVPIACWRKGHAREYLETELLPPPSTCYGFLLSLVGEENRERHRGVRVTAGAIQIGEISVVLRTLWRIKERKAAPGTSKNLRPDFQQIVSGSDLLIWLDSRNEASGATSLEERVRTALDNPASIHRFGGLSLGESTHLVDSVCRVGEQVPRALTFLLEPQGGMTMPVWIDHVGSKGTIHANGALAEIESFPPFDRVPEIPARS